MANRNLFITQRAKQGRAEILRYLRTNFSQEVAKDIDLRIDKFLINLVQIPYQWPTVKAKKYGYVHKAVINKRTIVLYKLTPNLIYILDIFDSRTNWIWEFISLIRSIADAQPGSP